MRVKCKFNDLAEIESLVAARLNPYVYGPGPDCGLEIGSEYFVCAIEFMWGGIWIYIEVSSRDYPFPYPIEFFEIVDSSIPVDWSACAPYRNQHLAIVSFQEWISDPNFYEKLLDDSPTEVAVYTAKNKGTIHEKKKE